MDYGKFLYNKLAVCYSDGSMSWSTGLGDFYGEIYEDKNTKVAPFMKSILYYDGSRYPFFSTMRQFVWILILASLIICVRKRGNVNEILIITMIGVTMFELLFEVYARHLNCNVPIMIIMSICGLDELYIWGSQKIGEKKW